MIFQFHALKSWVTISYETERFGVKISQLIWIQTNKVENMTTLLKAKKPEMNKSHKLLSTWNFNGKSVNKYLELQQLINVLFHFSLDCEI